MGGQAKTATLTTNGSGRFAYENVLEDICNLNWKALTPDDLISVAWVYYYFSVQFRECLETARRLYPNDELLLELDRGERNTDNLSPWLGVAAAGEKLNHDEFMRRTLGLTAIPEGRRHSLERIGETYLRDTRRVDSNIQALALASYEDGGLERVFQAILTASQWTGPLLQAFRHFLVEHIRFDNDPNEGHGALCRHLAPDDRILPLWTAFNQILIEAAPRLGSSARPVPRES
jgi:hypothetical protein